MTLDLEVLKRTIGETLDAMKSARGDSEYVEVYDERSGRFVLEISDICENYD